RQAGDPEETAMSDDGYTYTECREIRGKSVYYFDYPKKTAMLRTGSIPWRSTNPVDVTGRQAGSIGTIHGLGGRSFGVYPANGGGKDYLPLHRIVGCHTQKPHKQGPIVRFDLDDGTSVGLSAAVKLAQNFQLPGIVAVRGKNGYYLQCRDETHCADLQSLVAD